MRLFVRGLCGDYFAVPYSTSNYNSLQVSLNRRFSQGLTAGVAYTWSKLLTLIRKIGSLAAQDTYNLQDNYGASTLNTHRSWSLTTSMIFRSTKMK